MQSIDLKALKKKLSEYVWLAAAGEPVLITDRDRVLAEVVPKRPGWYCHPKSLCRKRRKLPPGRHPAQVVRRRLDPPDPHP
ncbi:hypothetical protein BH11PSE3_BH11PSE3_31750 [soil metagenome]